MTQCVDKCFTYHAEKEKNDLGSINLSLPFLFKWFYWTQLIIKIYWLYPPEIFFLVAVLSDLYAAVLIAAYQSRCGSLPQILWKKLQLPINIYSPISLISWICHEFDLWDQNSWEWEYLCLNFWRLWLWYIRDCVMCQYIPAAITREQKEFQLNTLI